MTANAVYEVARDYHIEVSKGLVVGDRSFGRGGINDNVLQTFTDISDAGGVKVLPSSAETLEIASSSASDTSAGTGQRTVLVITYDADFNRVAQVVTLNGTTGVSLTGTHIRTFAIVGSTAGSNLNNVGTITLQTVGGGTVYETMVIGQGVTNNSSYTVPAGYTGRITTVNPFSPKGEDATVRSKVIAFGGSLLIGGRRNTYQSSSPLDIKAPLILLEKTDLSFQASSTNVGATVTLFYTVLETLN